MRPQEGPGSFLDATCLGLGLVFSCHIAKMPMTMPGDRQNVLESAGSFVGAISYVAPSLVETRLQAL